MLFFGDWEKLLRLKPTFIFNTESRGSSSFIPLYDLIMHEASRSFLLANLANYRTPSINAQCHSIRIKIIYKNLSLLICIEKYFGSNPKIEPTGVTQQR